MSTAAVRGVVRQLGLDPEPPTDAALLTRYARHRDEAAFAEILRRRGPVVLCELGGKTRSEAARELGCPEGTVAARLHRARKLLADRLTRRGVALPAAGLGAVLCPAAATAAVAPELASATLTAARFF